MPIGNRDLAIDLGTANTLVYVRGEGIVVSEPSVVAIDTTTNDVHAVGEEAKRMIGRTPASISAIRPLRHGVIADFDVTEQMLRYFIRRVEQRRWSRPRVVMCAPSGITEVEKKAVVEASLAAGAREVRLIEEPVAAAIGAGLDISEPVGNMVVDVGGGTTEVAVLSLGGMVVSESLRIGGYELDEAISGHIRREHRIAIGAQTAEDIKIELGSAAPLQVEMMTVVRGRDLTTGLPKEVHLTSEEERTALSETVEHIIGAIKGTLDRTPPEQAADISGSGILLAGGRPLRGAFTDGVGQETGIPASLAESPLTCVAVGSGMSLEEFDAMELLDRPFERSASRRRLRPSRARAMS